MCSLDVEVCLCIYTHIVCVCVCVCVLRLGWGQGGFGDQRLCGSYSLPFVSCPTCLFYTCQAYTSHVGSHDLHRTCSSTKSHRDSHISAFL